MSDGMLRPTLQGTDGRTSRGLPLMRATRVAIVPGRCVGDSLGPIAGLWFALASHCLRKNVTSQSFHGVFGESGAVTVDGEDRLRDDQHGGQQHQRASELAHRMVIES